MEPHAKSLRSVPIETLREKLATSLSDEVELLERLALELGKGNPHEDLWTMLSLAAERDDRTAELAFAFERLCQPKGLRALSPAMQAHVLVRAARFFGDVFGDSDGATAYLERALAAQPANAEAFERLERSLADNSEGEKLCDLYLRAASQRTDRVEQLRLLRRAAELSDVYADDAKRVVPIYEQILKADPEDRSARRALEGWYAREARHADLAKLLEQSLAKAEGEDEARTLRERLVELCAGPLRQPERALPHVEELLKALPGHEQARKVARTLLGVKTAAARAAEILEGVHERLGETTDQVRMLEVQIDGLHGPKKIAPQKRLGKVLFLTEADARAFSVLERAIVADPTDGEVRMMFRDLASTLGRRTEAAAALAKAASATRDPAVRGRIGLETGQLWLDGGDAKRARTAFAAVLAGDADRESHLVAARALLPVLAEARDLPAQLGVLERLASLEDTDEARHAATLRLAQVATESGDKARAIKALEALAETPLAEKASLLIEPLYEATSAWEALGTLLDARAGRTKDRGTARALAVRAAELRTERTDGAAAAAAAWRHVGERYGHDRASQKRLLPLLEQLKAWDEVASTLVALAREASGPERGELWSRLAQVRMTRLRDTRGALEACRDALGDAPSDKPCRQIAERALDGDDRDLAADILEPIARAEGNAKALARVIEARAASRSGAARLALLEEAATVLADSGKEPKLALALAGRALDDATRHVRGRIEACVARVVDLGARGAPPADVAALLVSALGDTPVDDSALALLARRAGEAARAAGDVETALASFRRALAFDPTSAELLSLVDALLRESGTPAERIALHRAAHAQSTDPAARRELSHTIASLERRELGDPASAVKTLQAALAEDPADRRAHAALLETFAGMGRTDALYDQLAWGLAQATGDDRRQTLLRMADVATQRGDLPHARDHYLEVMATDDALGGDVLDAIEALATSLGDADLSCKAISRRAELALDPADEAAALFRLGDALAACGKLDDAVVALRRAAASYEESGDGARARASLEKILGHRPTDEDARSALVLALRRAGAEGDLYRVLSEGAALAATADERCAKLVAIEPCALACGRTSDLADAAAHTLTDETLSDAARVSLLGLRARLLAALSDHREEASRAHRDLLAGPTAFRGAAVTAFEAYLRASPDDPQKQSDRRALFAFQVETAASPPEQAAALGAWARAEELELGDPGAAATLYRRVLEALPESDEALVGLARILGGGPDVAAARDALVRLRDHRDGAERVAIDRKLGELWLATGDAAASIDCVLPILEASPGDEDALGIAVRALAASTDPGGRERVVTALVRAADRAEDARVASGIIESLLSATEGDEALASSRGGLFERLLDRAADDAASLDIALRAARELPAEGALWVRAADLARRTSRPRDLAEAYDAALRGNLPPRLAEDLGRAAVDLHDEWLDDPRALEALLERVFFRSSAVWAFDRLKAAYVGTERWNELLALYDLAIGRTSEVPTRIELLEDAAQAADFARDDARATVYLEALAAFPGTEARVLPALERLYERAGRLPDLVKLLERQLGATDEAERGALSVRIATVWVDAGDAARALGVIEPLLAKDPGRDDAYEVLERMLASERHSLPPMVAGVTVPPPNGRAASKVPNVRKQAAALLKKRYLEGGRAHDLVRVLDVELESVTNKKDRIRRYRELSKLRAEGLGDARGALEDVAALAMLEPGEAEHRARLATLADKAGAHDRRVSVLVEVSERARADVAASILVEAAEVCRDALHDETRAIELFRRALSSTSKDAALSAARGLAELLSASPREQLDALDRVAQLERTPEARREARLSLGRVAWGALGDAARAIAAFRAVVAEDPSSREAHDGIVQALTAESRWPELAEALERRAAVATSPVDARADRLAVARIHADAGDLDRALAVLRAIIEDQGASDQLADAEAALLERAERFDELALLLEGEAIRATDPARRVRVAARAGDVHRAAGSLAAATRAYATALDIDDACEPALAGLEAIARTQDGHPPALDTLVGHYRSHGRSDALIALTPLRVARSASRDESVEALLEAASLATGGPAFDLLSDAVKLAPGNADVRARLISAAAAPPRFREAVSAIEDGLAACPEISRTERRDALLAVAELHDVRLGDRRSAEDALTRASDGDDPEALARLVEMLRRAPAASLVDALRRLSRASGGDLRILREASDAAADQWDLERASAIAGEVLELGLSRFGPSAPPASAGEIEAMDSATMALLRATLDRGDVAAASVLAERASALPLGTARKRELLRKAADLAEREAEGATRAIRLFRETIAAGDEDGSATVALAALLRRERLTDDLVTLQRDRLARLDDVTAKRPLRLDVAALLIAAGDDAGARATLEAGLAEAPRDEAIASALGTILERLGLHDELLSLWESQATQAESDPLVARRLWARVAELAGEGERAIAAHRRAAALGEPTSLEALAVLAVERGAHGEAAEALERLWDLAPPDAREATTLRLVDAYVAGGRRREAVTRLETERARGSDAARARLATMYREDAAWADLSSVLIEQAKHESVVEKRHDLLVSAAEVCSTHGADPGAAVPLLEQAAALLPDDVPTSLALSHALRAVSRAAEATEVLRARIESYGTRRPKERASLHHALADTLLGMGDRAGALAELDVASRIDPAHPAVLRALGDLAFSDGQLDRAQRAYRALLLLLPRRPEKGTAGRAAILVRLAETEAKKGDAAKSAELIEAAFSQAAEHPGERAALEGELRERGLHELLARSLKARLALRTGLAPAERAAILGELSRLSDEHLGRPDQALDLRLEALALCPDDERLHETARKSASDPASRDRYVAAVTRAIEQGGGAADALWVQVGRALLGHDDARAAQAFERVPERHASAAEVGDALEAIYQRSGDTAALTRLLVRRVEAAQGAAKAEALYRLALAHAQAGDPERAVQALDEAAAAWPDDDRVLVWTRDLARRHPDAVPLLRAFERRARVPGHDADLIESLALLADVDEGGHALLREAAQLAERANDRDLAERMLRRAVDLPVTDTSREDAAAAMLALAELRTRAGAVGDAAALKDRAASLVEVGDQRALRLEVARLCATELGDLPRAAALYEALHAREPGDPEVWRPLADVYRKLGNVAALSALIDRVVATADDATERAALRFERATLTLRGEEPNREDLAATLLGEALDDDPAHREAGLLLSELLERSGKRGDLAAHLVRRIDAAKDRNDGAAVSALSLRLGALLEEDGRVPDARDVYHGALDWDPKSRGILRALFRIEEAGGDPLDVAASMDRLLSVETGAEAVELALRLASTHEANGDAASALSALEKGYSAFPESERLRRDLGQRYAGDWERTAALHQTLANARTGTGKLEPLRRVADELLPHAPQRALEALEAALAIAPADRATVAAMVAACKPAEDWDRALRALNDALARIPDDPDLLWERARVYARKQDVDGALADLQQAHELGRPCSDELLFVLEAAISHSTDPVAQRAHRRKRAGLLAGKGDRDGARAELTYLLRADAKDRAGLRMLATIEREDERWDAAIAAYRRLFSLEEGDGLAGCALELADCCERAGRLADARVALERAHRAVPSDGRLRPRLFAVYQALGERRELAAMTLENAGRENDVAERFRLLLDAAQLFLDAEPSDVGGALGALDQARRLRPEDDGLTALAAEAMARGGNPAEAVAALDVAIKAHRGRRSKALSLLHRKRSSIELLEGDLSAALESLERAFESDMSNAELALALGQLALDIDDRAVATRAFRSVTMMRPSAPGAGGTTTHDKAIAYLQMARLAVAEGDPRKARLFAEKAITEDASFEPARAFLEAQRASAPPRG